MILKYRCEIKLINRLKYYGAIMNRRLINRFLIHVIFLFFDTGVRLPMTPEQATKYYGSKLTEFERAEIEKYSEIWYLGLSACKIHGEEGASQNGGYDDDNGSYNKVLHDHISYRY